MGTPNKPFDDHYSRQLRTFSSHKQKEKDKLSVNMSMFFGQKPQISSEQKIAQAEAEIDMVSDMYSRLVKSCTAKCIDTNYREADLNKGESVCLDRCVSKFFEVNVKVSEKMQGEAQGKQGGGRGMFGGGM